MKHVPWPAALLVALFGLSGCQSIAEFAYDARAMEETRRCEALTSHPERQSCLARLRQAEKQAVEARKTD